MKLTPDHKTEIRNRFERVLNAEQLAELLQWIYHVKFPNARKPVVIRGRDLNYYAFKKADRYVNFEIPKRNKPEKRFISAPIYKLKTIQKCLNEVLNSIFIANKAAYGFIEKKSVVDNAKLHVGKNFVYNIDIEAFFPATDFRRVKSVLMLKPFSLAGEKEPLAFLIANLCSDNGSLPQGAPTSPTLTNIVCQRMDRRLTQLAKRYHATYTRYADDITFSCNRNIFDKWFKGRLKVIIERQERYRINTQKERLQDWNKRQVVTGVIVNKKLNVKRAYLKDVRFWLRTWEKFDTLPTQLAFANQYPEKQGYVRNSGATIPFQSYLMGKLLYLRMVRGKDDPVCFKYSRKFESLLSTIPSQDSTILSNRLLEVLQTLNDDGFEKADLLLRKL
jgi:RNA-directed DNA polymerase